MDFTVQVFQIIFYFVGIAFMITFMLIGIWSFIIFKKLGKTLSINNYILEKIHGVLSETKSDKPQIDINELLQDEIFQKNLTKIK